MSQHLATIATSLVGVYTDFIDAVTDNILTQDVAKAIAGVASDIACYAGGAGLYQAMTDLGRAGKRATKRADKFAKTVESLCLADPYVKEMVKKIDECIEEEKENENE